MALGAFTLAFVSIGAPILFFLIIRGAIAQYHTFLGKYDAELQKKYWGGFVDNVDSPMASVYSAQHYGGVYFTPLTCLYSVVMSGVIVGFEAESAQQLIACIVVQLIYSIGTLYWQAFRKPIVNALVALAQLYVVLMMLLQCVALVYPERPAVAWSMIVLSAIVLLIQIIVVAYAARGMVSECLAWCCEKKDGDTWSVDVNTGCLYSKERDLYHDRDDSGHYYCPTRGKWYDPEKATWYVYSAGETTSSAHGQEQQQQHDGAGGDGDQEADLARAEGEGPPTGTTTAASTSTAQPIATPEADMLTASAPLGDGWVFDEGTGLYYSEEENLYLDPASGHYYDDSTGMWYDPYCETWYEAS